MQTISEMTEMYFNPRSREGSDPFSQVWQNQGRSFQSTLPRRERRGRVQAICPRDTISIHAPAKGATAYRAIVNFYVVNFNPRSREGSDGFLVQASHREGRNFNPRSREGSDHTAGPFYCRPCLFQSTLPRRERQLILVILKTLYISIHAPAKGATRGSTCQSFLSFYFNPRSREGSDFFRVMVWRSMTISIHAPAKGATVSSLRRSTGSVYFNPRSREGSDAVGVLIEIFKSAISIHAPAKGATDYRIIEERYNYISIHAPAKGATGMSAEYTSLMDISIHAPAKGATINMSSSSVSLQISIHAPAKGATMSLYLQRLLAVISIHAPAKGATIGYGHYGKDVAKFQSTLPRRERQHSVRLVTCYYIYFNPRSREGSDPHCRRSQQQQLHFNPRSREGSDRIDCLTGAIHYISIHAPAKGATAKITYFIQNRDFKLDNTNKSQYF